jgi:hypothetical protein
MVGLLRLVQFTFSQILQLSAHCEPYFPRALPDALWIYIDSKDILN